MGHGIQAAIAEEGPKEGEEWIFLSSRDCNLLDVDATRAFFTAAAPTHVIHLAAKVGGLFNNLKHNVEFFRENMMMNDNVLLVCKELECRCVSCLSTCIFPDKTTYPINELMLHAGKPHSSNEGYSFAKRMVDVMNRIYFNECASFARAAAPPLSSPKHAPRALIARWSPNAHIARPPSDSLRPVHLRARARGAQMAATLRA